MTIGDDLFDRIVLRDMRVLRLEAGMRKNLLKQLKDLEKDIVDVLIKKDPSSYTRLQTKLSKTDETMVVIKQLIKDSEPKLYQELMEALRGVSVYAVDSTIKDWNNTLGADLTGSIMTKSQKAALASNAFIQGEQLQVLVGDMTKSMQNNIARTIRQSILNGEDITTMVRRIRGTRESGFTDGILNTTTNSAKRLVRTSINSTMNSARLNTIEENNDVIGAVQWVSTLDTRTSQQCAARDGLVWSLPDYEPVGHDIPWQQPPIHPNCRSTIIGIPKPIDDLPKSKQREIPEKKRASIDGEVSQSTNFEQWLGNQSESRQKAVLGETKQRLWANGQITLQDLLNSDGNVISVNDLLENL